MLVSWRMVVVPVQIQCFSMSDFDDGYDRKIFEKEQIRLLFK